MTSLSRSGLASILALSTVSLAPLSSGCGRLQWVNEAPTITALSFSLSQDPELRWALDLKVEDDDDLEFLTVETDVRDANGRLVLSRAVLDLTGGGDNTYHFSTPVGDLPEMDPLQSYEIEVTVTDLAGGQDQAGTFYEPPPDLSPPQVVDGGYFCESVEQSTIFVAYAYIDDDDGPSDILSAEAAFYPAGSGFNDPLATVQLHYDLDADAFQYQEFVERLPDGVGCNVALDVVFTAVDSLGLTGEFVPEP